MADLSLKSFDGLSELLSPLHYDNLQPIAPTEPGEFGVAKTLSFRSCISKDAKWGYMYNGAVLKCFPINSCQNETTWKWSPRRQSPFVLNTAAYHFPNSVITCATELAIYNPRINGLTKLLVGLNCGSDGGALVIYDPIIGKPIKWITTPSPVSSVIVLSNLEESGYTRPFFSEAMVAMVGIAAVGFHGGQLLIVDLGLDDPDISSTAPPLLYSLKTFKLTFVEPHEDYVAPKRRAAAAKNLLICLDFKSQDFAAEYEDYESNTFYYGTPDETLLKMAKDSTCVTCMEYIPTIGSLVVGFNFGGFQIWRIDKLQLEFTSILNQSGTPVHSICFQLPVDDPKNFCYLWILYGTRILEMQTSNAMLYALFYEKKLETEQFGSIYQNLHNCVCRLSIDLQDFYFQNESGNAGDQDVNDLEHSSAQRYAVRPLRIWNQTDNLVFFAWECNRNDVYMLGIFDLNQWYSAQTPARLNCVASHQLNPFWAAITLTIPFDVDSRHFKQLYDVQIIPKSLERWDNPHLKQDVHLFPASITFQAVCLSSIGTFTFEHFGVQEKLLRLIQKEGHQMLTEPAIVRQLCESFGIVPLLTHNSEEDLTEHDADRFFILSALLESRRPALIINIANHWVDGSFANLDCTLDLILRWITEYNYTLCLHVEEHWATLMKYRRDLPPETAHCLNYSNFVWNQINGLLMTLVRHDAIFEDSERNEGIECLQFALDKLVPYSAALLMLHRAGILPVTTEFDIMALLKPMYTERRIIVKEAVTNCSYLEAEHRTVPPLLIDSLMERFQESFIKMEWMLDDDEFPYPPNHPVDIFNMFMGNWMDAETKIISRIIFYFILDITHLLDIPDLAGSRSTLRGDFNSILKLTPEEQNEVLHLWYIDHGEFEKPLLFLCNGERIKDYDLLPWSDACILLAAQGCEIPVLHILSHFCFPNTGKLYINLLCNNQSTMSTDLEEILTSGLFANDQEMLFHCFEVARRKGILDHFITTKSRHAPISVQEELVRYIKHQPNSFIMDTLLLYFFITRRDDKNAEEHFERMKVTWKDSRNLNKKELEQWNKMKEDMQSFISNCRGNFIMNFLGYESGQPGVLKPAPLQLKTKTITLTQTEPEIFPLRVRKLITNGSYYSTMPFSPLKHFTGHLDKYISNTSLVRLSDIEEPTLPDLNSKSVTDLSILLKTPKIDRGNRSSTEEVESVLASPTRVHSILRGNHKSCESPVHFKGHEVGKKHITFLDASVRSSKSVMDLSILLKTPKIDRGNRIIAEEVESVLATPTRVHSLLRANTGTSAHKSGFSDPEEPIPQDLDSKSVNDLPKVQRTPQIDRRNCSSADGVESVLASPTPVLSTLSANTGSSEHKSGFSDPEEPIPQDLGSKSVTDLPIIQRTPQIDRRNCSSADGVESVLASPTPVLSTLSANTGSSEHKSGFSDPEEPIPQDLGSKSVTDLPISMTPGIDRRDRSSADGVESVLASGLSDPEEPIPQDLDFESVIDLPILLIPKIDRRNRISAEEVESVLASPTTVHSILGANTRSSEHKSRLLDPEPEALISQELDSKSLTDLSSLPKTPKIDRGNISSADEVESVLASPTKVNSILGENIGSSEHKSGLSDPEASIPQELDSKSVTDLSNLPKTPKIDHGNIRSADEVESVLASPTKVHSIVSANTGSTEQNSSDTSSRRKTRHELRDCKEEEERLSSILSVIRETDVVPKRRKMPDSDESLKGVEVEKRPITRSLSKKLGLEESIHNTSSLSNSFLNSSRGKRNTRAKSEEIETLSNIKVPRRTRASSETPDTPCVAKRAVKVKAEPHETDSPTSSFSMSLRRSTPRLKLELSDIDLDDADLYRSSSLRKRTRSGAAAEAPEPDIYEGPNTRSKSKSPPAFSISEAVQLYDMKRERSASPSTPVKVKTARKKERVFGYAPSLSVVAETSYSNPSTSRRAQLDESSAIEDSVLLATLCEEKPKKRRVKREKKESSPSEDEDYDYDAKSTTSTRSSVQSKRSNTSSKSKKSRSNKSSK